MRRRSWAALLHDAFELGIIAKAVFATVETLTGLFLFFLSATWVHAAARWMTAGELGEDPADWLSGKIMALAMAYNVSTQHFWAVYLIGHGLIKLAAVGALIMGYRWAYPLSILVLCGFIVWQVQKFLVTGSLLMAGLTVFDLIVIWLIWHEWRSLPKAA